MLKDYSRKVDEIISNFEQGYFPPLVMLARIMEETGEIARVLSHMNGKPPKEGEDIGDLKEELGDLLFCIICMANQENIDLDEAMEMVFQKIENRDKKRFVLKNKL